MPHEYPVMAQDYMRLESAFDAKIEEARARNRLPLNNPERLTRAQLDAYVDGVNACVRTLRDATDERPSYGELQARLARLAKAPENPRDVNHPMRFKSSKEREAVERAVNACKSILSSYFRNLYD